jgi:Tfp pilus assembly protein PilO
MKLALAGSKSNTFYLLIAGNLIVLALAGFFVLRPVLGLLSKHTHEISQTRSETKALAQKATALRQLKEVYPGYEAEYGPLVDSLPKTKDVAGYQTTLEDLAKLTQVTLTLVDTTAMKPGDPAAKTAATSASGFPIVPVKINVNGSFAQVLDFVSRLETMSRFTRVTGLTVSAESASGSVKANIDAQTLYFPGT